VTGQGKEEKQGDMNNSSSLAQTMSHIVNECTVLPIMTQLTALKALAK